MNWVRDSFIIGAVAALGFVAACQGMIAVCELMEKLKT
jgi:hypothetical protein